MEELKKELKGYLEKLAENWDGYIESGMHSEYKVISHDEVIEYVFSLFKQAGYVRLADIQALKKEMWDILKRWFPNESYGYTEVVGEICNLLASLPEIYRR